MRLLAEDLVILLLCAGIIAFFVVSVGVIAFLLLRKIQKSTKVERVRDGEPTGPELWRR